MARPLGAGRRDPVRRYAPLGGLAVVVVIALLVLPSALTLPQANPSTTLELAPIVATNHEIAPPSNFLSLSLAGSQTLGANGNGAGPGGPGGGLPAPGLLNGQGSIPPEFYDCVSGHQTEDPLTPPCSAYRYQGNNGGATYQGVSSNLIKVLIYYDGNGTLNTARGTDSPTPNTIVNMDDPPQQNEVGSTFVNRAWEHYFNQHFQTYDRHVQFWVQYGSISGSGGADATTREADAAFGYQTVHPFAAIDYGNLGGFQSVYNDYMLNHGVLIFGSAFGRSESFYQKYPGLQWGYEAPLEQDADFYAKFVCTKLYNRPSVSAGAGLNGIPRKFGFIADADPSYQQNYGAEDQLILKDLKTDCGLVPSDTVSIPHDGYAVDNQTTPVYATQNMAKMDNDHVTTLLWPVGYEVKQSQAAQELGYFPEWITGNDPIGFSSFGSDFQNQQEWTHAWVETSITYTPPQHQQICYKEYRSVDQQAPDSDVGLYACSEYNDLRQLFTGIQVAGPHLTPKSVDQGFHAIPAVPSANPQEPACYYHVNDYTCVKDAVFEWWDPNGTDPNNQQPGCWHMIGNGTRFLEGDFPSGNLDAQKTPGDVCNGYDFTVGIDPNPPSP